jgi:DegV family protein with EDD domain
MMVKVVTDSGSDITQEQAKQLGILIVPIYVRFGDEVYRDGIDIDSYEFYRKLMTTPIHPSTAAPSPGDFAEAFEQAAQESNEIVSIHITRKHSAVYDAALAGKEAVKKKGCRIEVVDSRGVTMWQGLVAIAAAKAAATGCNLQQVVNTVQEIIKQLRVLALLDTLEYVVKGGRISNTILAIQSFLSVKTFLTLRAGELRPAGFTRSRRKGIDRLREFIRSAKHIQDLSIVYSTFPYEADLLGDYARSLFPHIDPRIAQLGPALGVHAGPGALITVIREGMHPVKIFEATRIGLSQIRAG